MTKVEPFHMEDLPQLGRMGCIGPHIGSEGIPCKLLQAWILGHSRHDPQLEPKCLLSLIKQLLFLILHNPKYDSATLAMTSLIDSIRKVIPSG